MEETVEEIMEIIMKKIEIYGNDDRSWILGELDIRLMNESSECLIDEYVKNKYHE